MNKKLKLSALVGLLLFVGTAQAAKPDSDAGSEKQHSESFWNRWLGDRAEKTEKAKASEKNKFKEKANKHDRESDHYFSDVERSRITDYYRRDGSKNSHKQGKKNKGKRLPPGLQKKLARGGQLPPGWQTKVARGEVLDGELLRHSELVPDDLLRRLPVLRDGEAIRRVGDKVVRVLEGSGTVIDVIDLADILLR